MPYIELHAKSAFIFFEGASIPEALAGVCAERGLPAMALRDRDGVYGAPRFHHAAKKTGIRALLGSEITIRSPRRHEDTKKKYSPIRHSEERSDEESAFQFGNSAVRQFGNRFVPSCLRGEEFFRLP